MYFPLADSDRHPANLTGNERVILGLISTGSTDREIARLLVLELDELSRITAGIYAKLAVKSRLAATIWAIKNRLDRPADNTALQLYPIHHQHPPPKHLTTV